MRFTVLGKSPAYTDAGGACSSYLVEQGDFTLLVDCGNGAFGALRARHDYLDVDQILISHFHGDHVLDLAPFAYALIDGSPKDPDRPRLPVALPPGGAEALRSLVSTWGTAAFLDSVFELSEYQLDGRLSLGPIEVGLYEVPHYTLTHALELSAPSGRRIVYGADCGPNERLERAAAGAQLLVAEATLADASDEAGPAGRRGHMSAAEAGELAARADVERLVLTHFSDQLDPDWLRAQAALAYAGPIELAQSGASWEI